VHHPLVFNCYEFGTQASDILDMSQFHKASITKCGHRKTNIKLSGDRPTNYFKSLVKICQIAATNVKQAEKNLKV